MTTNNSGVTSVGSANSTIASKRFSISGTVGLLIAFFFVAIVVVQWQRLRLMDKLIESAAIVAAKDQINALATIRTVYTEDVVKVAEEHGIDVTHDYKVDGHSIPFPATLTMIIGKRIGETGSGVRTRLYSPYPFKWREAEGGLRDDFQREAWEKLSRFPDTPFSAFVNSENGRRLRYAVADRMRASCVACHNEHPESPRRGWKEGDVRGIVEVELPFRELEARSRQNLIESSVLMLMLATLGGAIILRIAIRFNRITSERDDQVRKLHDINATLDQAVEERTSKLRTSEERFELAVRGSTDGLWDWNVPTSEVYYSPRMKELLGYADDDFPNVFASFELRLHPEDHDWVMHEVDEHLQHRKPYDVQYRLRTKSGEYRWYRARGQAIWNDAGEPHRMAGSITDMTEEYRLRERFRLAVEASPAALLMVNQGGIIQMANSCCLNLFGYSETELVGQLIEVLVPERFRGEHPGHRNHFFQDPALRTMGAELELLGLRKDGSEFPVKVGLSPVQTAEGQVVICGVMDLTEQKRSLEAMQHAKEAAESASRAKSSFLANMSHEIRTPMNGIIGMSQLLARTELRSEQRDYLATVEESAQILLRLLNDILDLSKIEAGKLELESVDFSLSECVARATHMLMLRAAEKGLEIVCYVAPEIPDHLCGDAGRLQQVLVNLLGNAIKFTEAGKIVVNIHSDSISQERVRVHLSVCDSGIGIASEKLQQIFRPFEQAETSTTRRFGGTGLGLTISRQLVEMMGGQMWVESELGRGSTFHFTVELGISTEPDLPVPVEFDSPRVDPRRVLLVEDNEINRRVAVGMLRSRGHEVVAVENGKIAIEMLVNQRFDIVLMDMQMPVMDGYEATTEIRKREHHTGGHIPIVAMTAEALRGDRERCLAGGMDDYISKPIAQAELYRVVERFPAVCLATMTTAPSSDAEAAVPLVSKVEEPVSQAFSDISATGDLPPVDWEIAEKRVAGGPEMLLEIVALVKIETPKLVASIIQAIDTRDFKLLRRSAHTMKSTVSYVGAERLMQIALHLEMLGKNESIEGAPEMLLSLEKELSRVLMALDRP